MKEWLESKYTTVALLVAWTISSVVWEWQGFIFGLLVAFLVEAEIEKARLRETKASLLEDIVWLRERLNGIDPTIPDLWLYRDYTNLRPPPDEVVGYCPQCQHEIKRRELGRSYNGGW